MDKFLEIELKVLSIMKFDFDYDNATPFGFIHEFLHANFKRLIDKLGFQHNSKEAFEFATSVYEQFDKLVKELTLDIFFKSGSDTCLFWPPQIIAASGIILANEDEKFRLMIQKYGLKDLIFDRPYDVMSEEFSKLDHQ